jgi:hypothetical protein
MQNVTSVAGLKEVIKLLEDEQEVKGRLLKEQIYLMYESLKPVNLLRNTLKELFSSKYLIKNISGTILGATGRLLLNKFFNGTASNRFKKLTGAVIQFGISNLINKYPDQIRSFGQGILNIFSKRMRWVHEVESAR